MKLADMTGDGLQDIVFVDDGQVDYWPYLGNGHGVVASVWQATFSFPMPLSMEESASIPSGSAWRRGRRRCGGSGLRLVRPRHRLDQPERQRLERSDRHSRHAAGHRRDAVRLADMLGTGTDGILWTYDFRTFSDSTYKFLDLTGGVKPYVLNERNNNARCTTLVVRPLDPVLPGGRGATETRWRSRLPFPVQVVARVEVIDEISSGKLTTEYRYHHGYWDGEEREFRGFGMVEQLDTETFAELPRAGAARRTELRRRDRGRTSRRRCSPRPGFTRGRSRTVTGDLEELDCLRRLLGRRSACSRRRSEQSSLPSHARPRRPPIHAALAMPYARCAGSSCAPSSTPSTAPTRGSPLHGDRVSVRCARDRARRRRRRQHGSGSSSRSRSPAHHAMGARRRADDPVRLHRRLRRLRAAAHAGEPGRAAPRNPIVIPHRPEPYLSRHAREDRICPARRCRAVHRRSRLAQHELRDPERRQPERLRLYRDDVRRRHRAARAFRADASTIYDGDAFVGLPLGPARGFRRAGAHRIAGPDRGDPRRRLRSSRSASVQPACPAI